jgi:hypothetical protein
MKHEEGETRGRTLKARPFDDKVGFRNLPTQDLEALVIIILRIPRAESPNRNLCQENPGLLLMKTLTGNLSFPFELLENSFKLQALHKL